MIGDEEELESDVGEPLQQFKTTIKDVILAHKKAKWETIRIAHLRSIINWLLFCRNETNNIEAPLLDAILKNSETDDEAVTTVLTFVIGGFHTTGNLLAW